MDGGYNATDRFGSVFFRGRKSTIVDPTRSQATGESTKKANENKEKEEYQHVSTIMMDVNEDDGIMSFTKIRNWWSLSWFIMILAIEIAISGR